MAIYGCQVTEEALQARKTEHAASDGRGGQGGSRGRWPVRETRKDGTECFDKDGTAKNALFSD